MIEREKYAITAETSVIFPYYDERGKLASMILESGRVLFADASPSAVIDSNLRRKHQDRSQNASVRECGRGMAPIYLRAAGRICLMPTNLTKSDSCIWVAVGHVESYVPNRHGTVTVRLRGGGAIELPLRLRQFRELLHQARVLVHAAMQGRDGIPEPAPGSRQSFVMVRRKEDRRDGKDT